MGLEEEFIELKFKSWFWSLVVADVAPTEAQAVFQPPAPLLRLIPTLGVKDRIVTDG